MKEDRKMRISGKKRNLIIASEPGSGFRTYIKFGTNRIGKFRKSSGCIHGQNSE